MAGSRPGPRGFTPRWPLGWRSRCRSNSGRRYRPGSNVLNSACQTATVLQRNCLRCRYPMRKSLNSFRVPIPDQRMDSHLAHALVHRSSRRTLGIALAERHGRIRPGLRRRRWNGTVWESSLSILRSEWRRGWCGVPEKFYVRIFCLQFQELQMLMRLRYIRLQLQVLQYFQDQNK